MVVGNLLMASCGVGIRSACFEGRVPLEDSLQQAWWREGRFGGLRNATQGQLLSACKASMLSHTAPHPMEACCKWWLTCCFYLVAVHKATACQSLVA
eukprot:3859656-Amphidinium_carterae.1